MKAIFLFDKSGTMARPWADAGYNCYCYDIQNENTFKDGIYYMTWDADEGAPRVLDDTAFIACWPPCSDQSLSGALHFKGKGLRKLAKAIEYVAICAEYCDAHDCPSLIENPASMMTSYWREPDYKFHPAHYDGYTDEWNNYTKGTWLWCSESFVMPPRRMEPDLFNEPDKTYIHHQSPGKDRADIRSKTPSGFANAVYAYNAPEVNKGVEIVTGIN
jgi:hypothetical protein